MPHPNADSDYRDVKKGVFREYFELIVETAVFVFFVMTFVVQAFQIPTGSMEPTLLVGDFLLVNKLVYANAPTSVEQAFLPRRPIRRGDIIVFKYPNDMTKDYVKRAIGFPGESLEIRNQRVYINGAPIDEPYAHHSETAMIPAGSDPRDNFGPVTVPADTVFAMGDNRENSQDSRYWGFLPQSYIKGRPWTIYFSYKAEPDAYERTGIVDRLKKILAFLPKARWGRIFKLIR